MKINRDVTEVKIANKGIPLEKFCKSAGITRVTLSSALTGKTKPRLLTIGKIAKALGVPIEDIIKTEEVN